MRVVKKTIGTPLATFTFLIMQLWAPESLPKYCIQFCKSVVFNLSLKKRPLTIASFSYEDQNSFRFFLSL